MFIYRNNLPFHQNEVKVKFAVTHAIWQVKMIFILVTFRIVTLVTKKGNQMYFIHGVANHLSYRVQGTKTVSATGLSFNL